MASTLPYEGPIFDVQTHAIKPSSYDDVAQSMRGNSAVLKDTADIIIQDVFRKLADDLRGRTRLEALGKNSIHVVSVNTFFPPLSPETLLRVIEDINIWMAEKTATNPQLIGTASIPPPPILAKAGIASDGETFARKGIDGIRRAIVHLGLKGMLFASSYGGVFLGDASFDPYFALAEELGVPIIVHPALDPVEASFVPRKNIPSYSGFLNDQRTALLDLVMAGIYEKYPKLIIIATHLGGGILTSLGRFKVLSKRFPSDLWYVDHESNRQPLPKPIIYYLKKIYFDCNNAEAADIVHAASVVGHEHLLTGSDFPWTDDKFTREVLGELDESVRMKLAYENAAKIFGAQ